MLLYHLYLPKTIYHWLIQLLLDEKIELFITNDILLEYEEIVRTKYSESVASNFLIALKELQNVHFTQIYYYWNLIKDDPDDNKFVDCNVSAGAGYLITHDTDFSVLKNVQFPQINIVTIQEFEKILKQIYKQVNNN